MIPRILHHIYIGGGRWAGSTVLRLGCWHRGMRLLSSLPHVPFCSLPPQEQRWAGSCRVHHSERMGWQYMLWNESSAQDLIKQVDPGAQLRTAHHLTSAPPQRALSCCPSPANSA